MSKIFTNADIITTDWAKADRSAILRQLQRGRPRPRPTAACSGWGTDVTGGDPRSVRASVAGAGDFRNAWWNCFCAMYMAVIPDATLERAMYAFHRMHHSITLARMAFQVSVTATAADVERNGIVAAARHAAVRQSNS